MKRATEQISRRQAHWGGRRQAGKATRATLPHTLTTNKEEEACNLTDTLTVADGARFGALAVPHLIVVTMLSEAIVEEALRDLAGWGRLIGSTLPLATNSEENEAAEVE